MTDYKTPDIISPRGLFFNNTLQPRAHVKAIISFKICIIVKYNRMFNLAKQFDIILLKNNP